MTLSIFCDGGSRGNPGPAACAFLIYNQAKLLYQQGNYLGVATNNLAEYQAVLEALKHLSTVARTPQHFALSTTNFYLDSELVVKQLNGLYKIKDQNLKQKYLEIKKLQFAAKFFHIPRDKNFQADLLVNQTLDANK